MKKIFIFILTIISFTSVGLAQEYIDDDFLDIIENNAKPLWEQSNSYFNTNTVPEKYKNESAVIFGYKREISIDKTSKSGFFRKKESSLVFYENVRFKIKLLDRNAVKSFTEFYFRYSDKEDGFSAKVIKKDGISTNVSLANAVDVESKRDVPEFFKSFFDQEINSYKRYYKVAISDLEPGDILEYVTITKNKLDVRYTGYIDFSPQYEIFSKKYPILFNQIAIETDDKTFFKAMSKNGAPEFKKENSQNAEFFRYVLTDLDRPTSTNVEFLNEYKHLPFVKFQVIYSNNDNIKGALLGTRNQITSKFPKEELALRAWQEYMYSGNRLINNRSIDNHIEDYWKLLKKYGAKDWNNDQYINNAYYITRNFILNLDNYLSDQTAAYFFRSLLHKKEINSDLLVSVSNKIGTVADVLFEEELRYATKVGDKIYFNPTDYSNPNDVDLSLMNSEAYIVGIPDKKTNEQSIQTIMLPNTKAENNTSFLQFDVELNKDLNSLNIKRTSTYNGINKSKNIRDALRYTTFRNDDYKNYGAPNPTEKLKGRELDYYEEQLRDEKKNLKKKKDEYVKQQLESEFKKKIVYKNFTLINDGRSMNKPELIYSEEFELPNMVRKAGKKMLINLSGLVGSQYQLKKEERVRQYDVDVDYPRDLRWVINFTVPSGYEIEGLKEMNTSVDNEIGTFKCTTSLNNGVAKIEISKIYKQANFSKSKWNEMLQFIDAAYNQSFKNILLKPKN